MTSVSPPSALWPALLPFHRDTASRTAGKRGPPRPGTQPTEPQERHLCPSIIAPSPNPASAAHNGLRRRSTSGKGIVEVAVEPMQGLELALLSFTCPIPASSAPSFPLHEVSGERRRCPPGPVPRRPEPPRAPAPPRPPQQPRSRYLRSSPGPLTSGEPRAVPWLAAPDALGGRVAPERSRLQTRSRLSARSPRPPRGTPAATSSFLPPRRDGGDGSGPFPGVIDIYGVGGGLVEYRASLLAGHGFATMALAFYGFEDLPKEYGDIHLDYFEEALCYMIEHPQVKGPSVGLLGFSLGADICLSMASFLKNISATVSINGSGFSADRTIHYQQTSISPLGHDLRRSKVAFSGLLDIVDIQNDVVGWCENPSMIPVERAQGPLLFIVGQDDHNWRSELYAQIISERLQARGKDSPQVMSYPGTGHYIEPPYFPVCLASLHKLPNKPVLWGGEPRAHSHAQVDAWKQILAFFGKHLGGAQKRLPPKL